MHERPHNYPSAKESLHNIHQIIHDARGIGRIDFGAIDSETRYSIFLDIVHDVDLLAESPEFVSQVLMNAMGYGVCTREDAQQVYHKLPIEEQKSVRDYVAFIIDTKLYPEIIYDGWDDFGEEEQRRIMAHVSENPDEAYLIAPLVDPRRVWIGEYGQQYTHLIDRVMSFLDREGVDVEQTFRYAGKVDMGLREYIEDNIIGTIAIGKQDEFAARRAFEFLKYTFFQDRGPYPPLIDSFGLEFAGLVKNGTNLLDAQTLKHDTLSELIDRFGYKNEYLSMYIERMKDTNPEIKMLSVCARAEQLLAEVQEENWYTPAEFDVYKQDEIQDVQRELFTLVGNPYSSQKLMYYRDDAYTEREQVLLDRLRRTKKQKEDGSEIKVTDLGYRSELSFSVPWLNYAYATLQKPLATERTKQIVGLANRYPEFFTREHLERMVLSNFDIANIDLDILLEYEGMSAADWKKLFKEHIRTEGYVFSGTVTAADIRAIINMGVEDIFIQERISHIDAGELSVQDYEKYDLMGWFPHLSDTGRIKLLRAYEMQCPYVLFENAPALVQAGYIEQEKVFALAEDLSLSFYMYGRVLDASKQLHTPEEHQEYKERIKQSLRERLYKDADVLFHGDTRMLNVLVPNTAVRIDIVNQFLTNGEMARNTEVAIKLLWSIDYGKDDFIKDILGNPSTRENIRIAIMADPNGFTKMQAYGLSLSVIEEYLGSEQLRQYIYEHTNIYSLMESVKTRDANWQIICRLCRGDASLSAAITHVEPHRGGIHDTALSLMSSIIRAEDRFKELNDQKVVVTLTDLKQRLFNRVRQIVTAEPQLIFAMSEYGGYRGGSETTALYKELLQTVQQSASLVDLARLYLEEHPNQLLDVKGVLSDGQMKTLQTPWMSRTVVTDFELSKQLYPTAHSRKIRREPLVFQEEILTGPYAAFLSVSNDRVESWKNRQEHTSGYAHMRQYIDDKMKTWLSGIHDDTFVVQLFNPVLELIDKRIAEHLSRLPKKRPGFTDCRPTKEIETMVDTFIRIVECDFIHDTLPALRYIRPETFNMLTYFIAFLDSRGKANGIEVGEHIPTSEKEMVVLIQKRLSPIFEDMFNGQFDIATFEMNEQNADTLTMCLQYIDTMRDNVTVATEVQQWIPKILQKGGSEWRQWGIHNPTEKDKVTAFERMKDTRMLPSELTIDQYETWCANFESSVFMELDVSSTEVRRSIDEVLTLAVVNEHIGASDISESSLQHRIATLREPMIALQLQLGTIKAEQKKLDPNDPEGKAQKDALVATYRRLQQEMAAYAKAHKDELDTLTALNGLAYLRQHITLHDIKRGYCVIDGSKVMFDSILDVSDGGTLANVLEEHPIFKDDIVRIARTIEVVREQLEDESGGMLAGDFTIVDDFTVNEYFAIGEKPVESCQHYAGDPTYCAGLLSYVVDPDVRIPRVKDAAGNVVARCVVRMMTSKSGKPALYVEPIYKSIPHSAIDTALLAAIQKKAVAMGVPVFTTSNSDARNTDPDFKRLNSEPSRTSYRYTDSRGMIENSTLQIWDPGRLDA